MNKMTASRLHEFLDYEQTPRSSLGKMIFRNKIPLARALGMPCRYDIIGHVKAATGELPQVDLSDITEVRAVIIKYINDQMKNAKSEDDELSADEIKDLSRELARFYWAPRDMSTSHIRGLTTSFLKGRINNNINNTYNIKELMRALQSPLYSDVKGWEKKLEHMVAPDRARTYLGAPLIDWNNIEQVKKIIETELNRQTGPDGVPVDMEQMWKEYKIFVRNDAKEAAELNKFLSEDDIYQTLHKHH